MSTPVAAKAAPQPTSATPAPAAAQNISTVRAQKLRESQVRKLPPDRLQPEGHFSLPQRAQMPLGWDFEDALNPDFWAFVAHRMQAQANAAAKSTVAGAEIRLVADDLAFCADIMVLDIRKNMHGQADGLYVSCIGPSVDPATGKACPVDVKTGLPWTGRKPMTQKAD
jgi:hypothetical protein